MKPGSVIVLCSSANFYKHVNELAAELEGMGYKAVVPHNARQMAKTGDYDPAKYKTWYADGNDFDRKADFMRRHFDEVAAGDAVLVVNDEKHGVKGYIGPNALLEMGLAFYLKKPIYVLSNFDKTMSNYEEVYGMNSIFLNGELSSIRTA
jgi:nucleoside 2-deoxyribosyltransferase